MCNACFRIVRSWGTKSRLNIVEYLWILSMLGLLALLGRVTLYEDGNVLNLKISKPYLQFSIMD